MKNLLLALLLLYAVTSCSKEAELDTTPTEFSADQYPQKWQLVSMTGNIANMPAQTGAAMAWQEYYIIKANGTFCKTREHAGITTSASGTYKIDATTDMNYLKLTYENDSDIIGNCIVEPTETLQFQSEITLVLGEWSMCDGPRLEYKRVTYDGKED
ncbi:hypothetical protein [Pontibacter cellulosilyticus]|uniref:Lipocalin-like domain-containing protein n=1 Tax=Pontibacter cellulosilyticus TaxID=1720253 RepID=A0A923NB88_9BACT|nr:hypothetical protein [Pontibacter cellulosilyticus]MBC5995009.1 hypothetical protein [Pontibacter cellulosilyticus]